MPVRIAGTEDPKLYEMGVSAVAKEIAGTDDDSSRIVKSASIVMRNKSIAQSVIDMIKAGLKPILFVGKDHVAKSIAGDDELRKKLQAAGRLDDIGTIEDHLKKAGIGYQRIAMKGHREGSEADQEDQKTYDELFLAQQNNDVQGYVRKWLKKE